jgi:general secretion pathway protein A
MYCDFYGFKEKPFTLTPNPRFIFLSKNHKEAFAHLLYGIDNHCGFIALTGEVGTGKTTVLRTLLDQLDEACIRFALILNPCLSAPELLASINREFAIPAEGLTAPELLDTLNRFLLAENRAGRTVVLVIDEAQNLEPQVLEQIRLISNLETETEKLIQIVLAGQPELAEVLRRPELRQLGQRITVRYHLAPLDFNDTAAYIDHRLEMAGGWRAATFNRAALKKVYHYSGGIPRLINIVCDRALLIGYIDESREISGQMAARAVAEIKVRRNPAGLPRLAWVLGLLALLAGGGIYLYPQPPVKSALPPPAPSTTAAAGTGWVTAVDMRKELAGTTETDSAVNAFNALAKLWNVPPLTGQVVLKAPMDMERLAGERGLRLARLNGNLGLILRADTPALLELTLPGVSGRRYLALTGTDNGRLLIAPPLAGRTSLASTDLESCWTGRAYLFWKNYRDIPYLRPGMKGEGVTRLQQLLREVGSYQKRPTGAYDRETADAVRNFQAARGIPPNGNTGAQTLLFLYRAGSGFSAPRLEKKGGNERG